MGEMMTRREKITLVVFVVITITAGFIGYLLDQILSEQPEGSSLGMGLWLILPLLTGIVLRIINKDIKQIGVYPNFKHNLKWYAAALLIFPCITLIIIILAKITSTLTVGKVEIVSILVLMISTFFINCVKNIFEEFAWRGCLVPFLQKTRMNDWCLYFFSGLIWGMWHITYYLFFLPDKYFTETSRPMMVIAGIVIMIFWSPLFVELRWITGSVWPCVILHSIEDAVPTLLFVTSDAFRINEEYSLLLDPTTGVISTILVLGAGIWLRNSRIKKEHLLAKKA